jgi:hypothetical protein
MKNSTPSKVLFVGYGRAGKDEAAQFCELHLGLRYGGSFSWHAKEDVAKFLGVHPMTAWETRHKNRQVWYEQCNALREREGITILARRALQTGDICAGLRDKPELDAVVAEKLFDVIVWVDNPLVPVDPTVTFTKEDVLAIGGLVLPNYGTLAQYHAGVLLLFESFGDDLQPSAYAKSLLGGAAFVNSSTASAT